MPAPLSQVRAFLSDFKQAAMLDLNVLPREKNVRFLTKHGFTAQERKEVLLGLEAKDEETEESMRHALCISFHDAAWPMDFPYKGS